MMFQHSKDIERIYPGFITGFLAIHGVDPRSSSKTLEDYQLHLEAEVRKRYSGMDRTQLKELPQFSIYGNYYRKFRKTYHLLLQLESITLKGRSIPPAPPMVRIMFLGEMKNLLLTAVHDLDKVELPLSVEVAKGEEKYTGLNGKEQELKKEDLFMRDRKGILSSIIYGPDRRTSATEDTRNALFPVYGPPGIDRTLVESHLRDLEEMTRLFSPGPLRSEIIILP